MTATLHLAAIGYDKTAHAISLLPQMAAAGGQFLPKVWVLLATRRQEMSFRQRLSDAEAHAATRFNIEFYNFYSLNTGLLKLAGEPVRRLNPLTRYKLLRHLLSQMLSDGQLSFFHQIAETRGFAAVLAELIDEFKQNNIRVEDFAAAARSRKDIEIAAIYQRYQDALRRSDLADVEGEGWLALATLRRNLHIAAGVDMLLVDGFDQFTPVQAQLLAELSRSIENVHITLTALPKSHSGLLPSRSVLARSRLQKAFADVGLGLETQALDDSPCSRHPDLQSLGANIFHKAASTLRSEALALIEMPDPWEETRSVLRAVKTLLLQGESPDEILIVLRDWVRYATYFETGAADYELPLLPHDEGAYHRVPVIAALIDLLQLAPRFRRRDLLDVLRSPYFDVYLDDGQIDLLDRISLEQQFLGGSPADWLALIKLAQQPFASADPDVSVAAITDAQAETLSTRLTAFFAAVTPVESAETEKYIGWIAELLGADPHAEPDDQPSPAYSLNIIRNAWANERANQTIVTRDITALNGLKAILRDLRASDDILSTSFQQPKVTAWQDFWSDLKVALETRESEPFNRPRNGKILVTTATEARGLPHARVFILGMAEGVFPAEATEDPLYLDSEREQLQRRGIRLQTRAERMDDRGLFYELLGLPQRTLTLSRPTYESGKPWIESYLWRAVRQVFPEQQPMGRPVGSVVPPRQAANSGELLLALADQLAQPDATRAETALRMKNWLLQKRDLAEKWQRLSRHRSVESRRLSQEPFDQYSGILSQPLLLKEAASRLGAERAFSASSLKDYGLCGFRYFAKRLLKLEESEEPEEGVDALQLGSLNHSILEETYKRFAALELEIGEANLDKALRIFREVAEAALATAPATFGFRATATWEQEKQMVVKRLAAMIGLDFSAKSPLHRYGAARSVRELELQFNDVFIDLPGGAAPIRARGVIDRIERAGDNLVIVDYKTGSTPISRSELESGRDFQMMIYLEALAQQNSARDEGARVKGGMFWHLRNLTTSGAVSMDDEDDLAALAAAKAHVAENLQLGRAGMFPVRATKMENGKCSRYCEYSRFCRMHVTGRFKPAPRIDESSEGSA